MGHEEVMTSSTIHFSEKFCFQQEQRNGRCLRADGRVLRRCRRYQMFPNHATDLGEK